MKKIVLLLFGILPLAVSAQNGQKVNFITTANWSETLSKAKKVNKIIFVDALATWCIPCRKMDSDIYTIDSIAEFINTNYIAVKVQFDKAEDDPEYIKKWYQDAEYIMKKYKIEAFPTFLFISPDGTLLERGMGYKDEHEFMTLAKTANDPKANYAGVIKQYRLGEISDKELLPVALLAKQYHDDSVAIEIAKKYKSHYLDKHTPDQVLSPKFLEFMAIFYQIFSTQDRIAQYLYAEPAKADLKMENKGYSKKMTDYLITKDYIDPLVKPYGIISDKEPNWKKIENKIQSNYDRYTAEKLVIYAKLNWYDKKQDWPNIVKYSIKKMDVEEIDTIGMASVGINNLAYNIIFQHSDDQFSLNKGISYMELILMNDSKNEAWLDTYANLLYKIGEKEKAIRNEKMALSIAKDKNNIRRIKLYEDVLRKMEENEPTWSIK
jgi:thioredoxin-related protein